MKNKQKCCKMSAAAAVLWLNLIAATSAVNLNLQYFSQCVFHHVHFSGSSDLSQGVLGSNQYGQPWTVHNMSRPWLREMVDDVYLKSDLRLRGWESRFCNVHLLIHPLDEFIDWRDVVAYARAVTVRHPRRTFMILVYASKFARPFLEWYNLEVYGLSVYTEPPPPRVYFQWWSSPFDKQIHFIPMEDPLNGEYVNRNFRKGHRSLQGRPIQIMHSEDDILDNAGCPSEGDRVSYGGLGGEFLRRECLSKMKMTNLVAKMLNGTGHMSYGWINISYGTVIRGASPRFQLFADPATTFLLVDTKNSFLVYCDYDKKRQRNDSEWLNAFDVSSWVLVLVNFTLITIVVSTRLVNFQLKFVLELSKTFKLLGGKGNLITKFHLLVTLCGCVLVGYYETYLTSMLLAPSPALVYHTVKELFEGGYKIRLFIYPEEDDSVALRREADKYRDTFDRKRIGHLLNTSFAIGNIYEKSLRGLAMDVPWPEAAEVRTRLDFTHPETICHYIPESMNGGVKSWMIFHGYLSDEAAKYAGWLLEFGLHYFWEGTQRARIKLETEAYRRRANTTSIRDAAGPKPISMEFGIMQIFPICGVIAGVAGLVLCMECLHHGAVRANIRERVKLGLVRAFEVLPAKFNNGEAKVQIIT